MFKAKRGIRPNPLVLQGIKKFTLFSLTSLFLLGQSAWAIIAVVDGGNQTVVAGSPSKEISFQVFYEQGNPYTVGEIVNFTLVAPSGKTITDGLSNHDGKTGENGLVATTMNAQQTVGNYTVTATLATDNTQTATTSVVVVANAPSQIKVISGGEQTITVGQNSATVTFQITDALGNVATKQTAFFELQLPTGEIAQTGIFPTAATSNNNGEVATRFEATENIGEYQIIATLVDNNTVTAKTSIQVTEALPQLSSLGAGVMVDPQGNLISLNEVSFYGGTSVDDGPFFQDVVLEGLNNVLVQSIINVAPEHVGQPAEIVLVIILEEALGQITLWMRENNDFNPWDGDIANLTPYFKVDSLPTQQFVNIYGGPLGPLEWLQIQVYLGYRLEDGSLIFNGNKAVQLLLR